MLKTKNTDFNKALILIRGLEDQYGSLLKVSYNNPKLKQIHKLVHAQEIIYDKLPGNQIKKIVSHINNGYNRSYITSIFKITDNEYYNILERYGLQQKPTFKYVVTKPDGFEIYCTNQKSASAIFGLKSSHPLPYLIPYCRKCRCSIRRYYTIWKNIPDGSGYIMSDGIVHIKRGIDSFAQISA